MSADLILAPEAGKDIAEAYHWYEQQRSGLGEEFLSSLDAAFSRIRRHPRLVPICFDNYRRTLIRKFPYTIFYEHMEARIIVYAVFHAASDPQKWRDRIE